MLCGVLRAPTSRLYRWNLVEEALAKAMEGVAEQAVDEAGDVLAEKLEQHGEAFAGFFGDVQNNVLNSISARAVGPQGVVENIQGDVLAPPTTYLAVFIFASLSRFLSLCIALSTPRVRFMLSSSQLVQCQNGRNLW